MKEVTSQGFYIKKDSKIILWRILCEWIDCLDKMNKFFEMLIELTEEKKWIGLYLLQKFTTKIFSTEQTPGPNGIIGEV